MITEEEIHSLRESGMSWAQIRRSSGLSIAQFTTIRRSMDIPDTIYKINVNSPINEKELFKQLLRDYISGHRNCGYRLILGYFLTNYKLRVTRQFLLLCMREIDLAGITRRRMLPIQRIHYDGHCPGHVTHLDTHHKLSRYGFITFGAIDGYSREIITLKCLTNNRAYTLVKTYTESTNFRQRGIPMRIRGDYGKENLGLMNFINIFRNGNHHYIAGRSVNNQRIERLWRDVHRTVTKKYQTLCKALEEVYNFDFTVPQNVFILQSILLQPIQQELDDLVQSWNHHRMSMFSRELRGTFTPTTINLLLKDYHQYISYEGNEERVNQILQALNVHYEPDERPFANSMTPFTNEDQLNRFLTHRQLISPVDDAISMIQKMRYNMSLAIEVRSSNVLLLYFTLHINFSS